MEYLPNGVDCDSAIDREGAARRLAEAGIEGPFVLFAARRVMATKGAHTLLEAIGRLAAPPTVVILGELDHLPAYTRRLHALARGNPDAMRARASRARQRVLEQYAGERVAERYAELYERARGAPPAGAVDRRSLPFGAGKESGARPLAVRALVEELRGRRRRLRASGHEDGHEQVG